MQKQLKPLPAFDDPNSRDFLQKSLEGVAAQVAKRNADLAHQLEHTSHETPLLAATQDAVEAPVATPGALWFVQDDGLVYFYDAVRSAWLAASVTVLGGNQTGAVLGASHYLLSRVSVPAKTYVEKVYVGIFGTAGFSGHIDITQIGGGIIATEPFFFGSYLYQVIEVAVNAAQVISTGLQVEMYIDFGVLPVTDCVVLARKMVSVTHP